MCSWTTCARCDAAPVQRLPPRTPCTFVGGVFISKALDEALLTTATAKPG
jgi:hypothetical protein